MATDFDSLIDRRCTESMKWHHYGEGVLPMWVADMDFRSPEPVIQALKNRVEHGIFGYGEEPRELRELIVDRLHRLYSWDVNPQSIVFLPGVIAGFNLACHAFAEPGDGVLIQTPVYPPILRANKVAGLVRNEMELVRLPDGSYEIDFRAFEAAITDRTRVFILCNPHNPVGRVFRKDELEKMAEICFRHDVLICSDEIHGDLIFSGNRHLPIASLSPEIAKRTVTLMAPSKTYNIAGLECSYAIIPDETLRKEFEQACHGLAAGVNLMGFIAAQAAYRDGQPWLDALLPYLEGNRDYLLGYIAGQMPQIHVGKPEGTFLAWLDCRDVPLGTKPCEFFINEAGVAMNDGATFGRGGEGFVRLNYGCPRSMLVSALEKMKTALETVRTAV